MTKSRGILPPRQPWTDEQLEMLRRDYPNTLTRDLVVKLGHPEKSIHGKAKQLGVRKSSEWLSGPMSQRLDGHRGHGKRFQPGNKPWCAGTKGVVGTQQGCRATQFRKGEMAPRNQRMYIAIGGHRINSDGYLDRKVRDDGPPQGRFERVHRLVWIEAFGPIPEGHIVTFRDGRRTNVLEEITIDRLECITNAEHLRRRAIHNLPPELADIARLRGRITRAIREREECSP